jgi:hypothetical protein
MIVLTSDFGWVKFLAWTVLFISFQSPLLLSSEDSYAGCASWLLRKKR